MWKFGFIRYQLPAVLFTILIFILSSYPSIKTPSLGFNAQDKLLHLVFYTLYGIFLSRAFYNQDYFIRLRDSCLLVSVAFGILYGLSDEFHQYFVPGRDMDFWDFVADSLGVISGALLFHYRYRIKKLIPVALISRNK